MYDQCNLIFGCLLGFPFSLLAFPTSPQPHLQRGAQGPSLCHWVPWDAGLVKRSVFCALRGAACLHDEASVLGGPSIRVALPFRGTSVYGSPRAPRLPWLVASMWDDLSREAGGAKCLCSEVWRLEGLAIILMSHCAAELSQRAWA